MRVRILILFLLVAASPVYSQTPPSQPLRTAGDRPIDIQHIRLDLKVDLPKKTVDSVAYLRFATLSPVQAIALDAVGFDVKSVALGVVGTAKNDPQQDKPRVPLKFRTDDKKLSIDLPAEWPADKAGWLIIHYIVHEPKEGLFFFGPTPAEPDVPLTVWSQGEAVTNRYWIPCLDHPDQRQTTEMFVTVANGFEVLSNGKLVSKKENDDKTATFHWSQDKPHVSYLVTLVVGKFEIVKEDYKGIPLLYYVPPSRKEETARTFGRTREMMEFFTARFGIQYPWEKYAQVVVEQFTSGGMENTSATTLNDRALHDERSFLDSSPDPLIAHELGHQWWGDLLTCRDWAHIWLNEGFASFCEIAWAEHHLGREEADYQLLSKARLAISGGKDRPVVDRRYDSPRMMFDARAYPKGAWVLQMLRAKLGEEIFWKCLRTYGNEHKFKSVETSDLRRTCERVSGKSLEQFFLDWTERPGSPVLDIASEYLPESKQLKITVKQTQAAEPFHFALPVRVISGDKTTNFSLSIADREQVAYFQVPGDPDQVLIDPDFTVLADFNESKSRGLWAKQLLSGPTIISRIRAAAFFAKSKALSDRELLATALKQEKFWGVATEIARALAENGGDVCRDALIVGLGNSHPKVRRACAAELGKFKKDAKVIAALKGLLQKGDASYFVESAAIGAYAACEGPEIANVLLPWLSKNSYYDVQRVSVLRALGESRDLGNLDTLIAWTKRGKSRPTRIAALLALANLAQKTSPNADQQKRILDAIVACVTGEGEMPQIRRNGVTALRDLGQMAKPRLDVLEAIQRHDPDEYVQELTKKAIEQARGNTSASAELGKLKDELEKLKKQNQAMQERLDRLEKVEKKTP